MADDRRRLAEAVIEADLISLFEQGEIIRRSWYWAEWVNLTDGGRGLRPPPSPLYLGIPDYILELRGAVQ